MAGSPSDPDRDAILERRALLVASALATLGVSGVAHADQLAVAADDELGACEVAASPSPAQLEAGAERLRQAREAMARGDHVTARSQLLMVYRELRLAEAVRVIAQLRLDEGDFEGAVAALAFHLECVGTQPGVRQDHDWLMSQAAHLVVTVAPDSGTVWTLDGRSVSVAQLRAGIRVAAGGHMLRRVGAFGREDFPVELSRGETREINLSSERLPPEPPPMPCLSIAEPEPSREAFRAHAGLLGPLVAVSPSEEPQVLAGAGLRLALATQPAPNLWLELDAFGALAFGSSTLAGLVGSTLEVRYHPGGVVGFGLGFSGGYLDVDGPAASPLEDSGFFGPVLVPLSLLAGPAQLELRVPVWLSSVSDTQGVSSLGVGMVAPHLVVSVGGEVFD